MSQCKPCSTGRPLANRPEAGELAVRGGAFAALDPRGSAAQEDSDCRLEPKRGGGRFIADLDGFNLHVAVRIEADDEEGRERLVRSCARPCFALDRLRVLADGRIQVRGETMTLQEHIVRDPAVCGGQPVIRGTRVLVRVILGYLAHGQSVEAILHEFPSLGEADVRAVIAFAAASASEDLPAPSPVPPEVRAA